MDVTIANIKRIHNGWLAHVYKGNSYLEVFMDDDELTEVLNSKENRHKLTKDNWKELGGDEGKAEEGVGKE